jgi:hypothetical protein
VPPTQQGDRLTVDDEPIAFAIIRSSHCDSTIAKYPNTVNSTPETA